MTFTTLAIMAESGHGKDFCGAWIRENRGFKDIAFADHIKRFCRTLFRGFSDDALWGEPALRNQEVPLDWQEASYRCTWGVDDWIMTLQNLTVEERAEYKPMVLAWFQRVKEIASNNEGKMSPRMALQLLGTEYGRAFKKDIWSGYAMKVLVPALASGAAIYSRTLGLMPAGLTIHTLPKGVVITDCRFGSELTEVQQGGGYVLKIVRLSKKGKENEAEAAGIKGHASEAELRTIPDEAFDLVLEMGDGGVNVYPRLLEMFNGRAFETRRTEGKTPWVPA